MTTFVPQIVNPVLDYAAVCTAPGIRTVYSAAAGFELSTGMYGIILILLHNTTTVCCTSCRLLIGLVVAV